MSNSKASKDQPNYHPVEKKRRETTEWSKQPGDDAAIKEALKKEKQPVNIDDLSPLHNNQEIGTSGGDQRAGVTELKQAEKAKGTRKKGNDTGK